MPGSGLHQRSQGTKRHLQAAVARVTAAVAAESAALGTAAQASSMQTARKMQRSSVPISVRANFGVAVESEGAVESAVESGVPPQQASTIVAVAGLVKAQG